jgi:integrase/recombinase XerD
MPDPTGQNRPASRNRAYLPRGVKSQAKVARTIGNRAEVQRFSTHTLRHLCLTDLARAGWELHTIATFAGHASLATTLQYIHLSGRDLAAKLERGMAEVHAWRVIQIGEVLGDAAP